MDGHRPLFLGRLDDVATRQTLFGCERRTFGFRTPPVNLEGTDEQKADPRFP